MTTGTPLDRTALNDLINLDIYDNVTGEIKGSVLQAVLLYVVASAPNLLTDGFLTGNPGATVNPDLTALLAAIKSKAEQNFVVSGLAGKEPKFSGLAASDLNPDKSAYASTALYPLLAKLVNAISGPVDLTLYATIQQLTTAFNNRRALFVPLTANQLDQDKADYANLTEQPLFIKIINALSAAKVPTAPAAPTDGQVDDTADTFSFLPNPFYPSFAQYKVNGLPGINGAVVLDGQNSYVQGNRIYIKVVGNVAKGGLAVYVAGSGNMPDGAVLTNADPFTGVATPVNQKPTVSFAPVDNSVLTAGTAKQYQALATDPDGTITLVELVLVTGASSQTVSQVLDSDTTQPYLLTWTPATSGTYYLAARATDNQNATALSSVVTVTVQAATGTPPATPVLGQPTATSSTITNAWTGPAGTQTLERALVTNGAAGTFQPVYSNTAQTYQDGPLPAATTYAYRVKITVNGVDSAYSNVVQIATSANQQPTAPANLRATATTSSTISLAWDATAGTYTLQRAPVDSNGNVGTFATIYTNTTAAYQDMGLTYMSTYAYRVLVTVNGVASPYSTVYQATTAGQATGSVYQSTYQTTY